MEVATGNLTTATERYEQAMKHAFSTPFSMEDSIKGMVDISLLGLQNAERALMGMSNIAAMAGTEISTVSQALFQMHTQTMRQFGLEIDRMGSQWQVTFRNKVYTPVTNDMKGLRELVVNLGMTEFEGLAEKAGEKWAGSIAQFKDRFTELGLEIMQTNGTLQHLSSGVRELTADFSEWQNSDEGIRATAEAAEILKMAISATLKVAKGAGSVAATIAENLDLVSSAALALVAVKGYDRITRFLVESARGSKAAAASAIQRTDAEKQSVASTKVLSAALMKLKSDFAILDLVMNKNLKTLLTHAAAQRTLARSGNAGGFMQNAATGMNSFARESDKAASGFANFQRKSRALNALMSENRQRTGNAVKSLVAFQVAQRVGATSMLKSSGAAKLFSAGLLKVGVALKGLVAANLPFLAITTAFYVASRAADHFKKQAERAKSATENFKINPALPVTKQLEEVNERLEKYRKELQDINEEIEKAEKRGQRPSNLGVAEFMAERDIQRLEKERDAKEAQIAERRKEVAELEERGRKEEEAARAAEESAARTKVTSTEDLQKALGLAMEETEKLDRNLTGLWLALPKIAAESGASLESLQASFWKEAQAKQEEIFKNLEKSGDLAVAVYGKQLPQLLERLGTYSPLARLDRDLKKMPMTIEEATKKIQDMNRYLNMPLPDFIPMLKAMQSETKYLGDDWKKIEDLIQAAYNELSNFNREAGQKTRSLTEDMRTMVSQGLLSEKDMSDFMEGNIGSFIEGYMDDILEKYKGMDLSADMWDKLFDSSVIKDAEALGMNLSVIKGQLQSIRSNDGKIHLNLDEGTRTVGSKLLDGADIDNYRKRLREVAAETVENEKKRREATQQMIADMAHARGMSTDLAVSNEGAGNALATGYAAAVASSNTLVANAGEISGIATGIQWFNPEKTLEMIRQVAGEVGNITMPPSMDMAKIEEIALPADLTQALTKALEAVKAAENENTAALHKLSDNVVKLDGTVASKDFSTNEINVQMENNFYENPVPAQTIEKQLQEDYSSPRM